MEKFDKYLKSLGLSEETRKAYQRAVRVFKVYLESQGETEKDFREDSLITFLSSRYKGGLPLIVSAINRYLTFLGLKKKLKIPKVSNVRDINELSEKDFKALFNSIQLVRSQDLRISFGMMVFLGLTPSQVVLIKKEHLVSSKGNLFIETEKFKRLVLEEDLKKIIEKRSEEINFGENLVSASRETIKVSFHRFMNKFFPEKKLTVKDFRDNYALKLLKLGFPQDIVCEFTGLSQERVGFLFRFKELKSKEEIIETVLKNA